jgi:hypothetical protein
MHTNFYS